MSAILKVKDKDGNLVDIPAIRGSNGVGVRKVIINNDGELEITYTNNTTVNVGKVVGAKGDPYEPTKADKEEIADIILKKLPDLPSGGGEWKVVCDFTTTEEVKYFTIDTDIEGNPLSIKPNEETLIFGIAAPTDTNTANKDTVFIVNGEDYASVAGASCKGTARYTRRYIKFGDKPDGFLTILKGFHYLDRVENNPQTGWLPNNAYLEYMAYLETIKQKGLTSIGYKSTGVLGVGSRIVVFVKE